MQLNGGSYFSQDDSYESGCTPRNQDRHGKINSPQNRKKRGRFFAIFGKSNAENIETEPSHFASSQDDSNQFSQFSQDFTERLGGLSMKASQDHTSYSDDSRSMFSSDGGGNSYPFGSNSNSAVSNRASKFTPFSSMKAPLSQSKFSTNREVPLFSSSSTSAKRSEGATSSNGTQRDCMYVFAYERCAPYLSFVPPPFLSFNTHPRFFLYTQCHTYSLSPSFSFSTG